LRKLVCFGDLVHVMESTGRLWPSLVLANRINKYNLYPSINENMNDPIEYFQTLYTDFNKRNIELAINKMTDEVEWANGMEGGFVYRHAGVREYWTRQFKLVSSSVTPLEVRKENGVYKIEVHQVVHDLEGKLLADEMVTHIFEMEDDEIARFRIEK